MTGWGTLGEVREGLGDPLGGTVQIGSNLGTSETGRETLEEVWDG